MKKEAKARVRINRFLERAGWRFFDDEKGPAKMYTNFYIQSVGLKWGTSEL